MDKEILEVLNKLLEGQAKLEAGQAKLEAGQAKLEAGQEELKIQVIENTQILRALVHSAEVNKAEHDKMMNDIAHMNGNIEAIKKDLSQVELVTANNWADIVRLKAVK